VQPSRIAERDGWWCWLCGEAIEPDAIGPWQATIDHLVPRSRGGSNELSNLRLAHRRCNNRRGSHLPELDWPRSWPLLMAGNVWTTLARLAPHPGSAEIVAMAPIASVAGEAATWIVERAESFVPGGWESWCVAEPSGPVVVWLRRVAGAEPGSAGRPKVPDP